MFINLLTSSLCAPLVKSNIYRKLYQKSNYYEVLKLNQNCTKNEIKRAYIDLSKQYHPDKNAYLNPQLFLEVSEAYKILSKSDSRQEYDFRLLQEMRQRQQGGYDRTDRRKAMHSSPYFYRHSSYRYNNCYDTFHRAPAKGMTPVIPNLLILFSSMVFIAIVILVQIITIKHAMRIREEEMKLKNAHINRTLANLELPPENHTNQHQVAILEAKFRLNGAQMD